MAQIRLRYGGIPEPLLANADLLALVLPALRADVMAVETYRYDPEPPLDCPMWAFGGVDDPEAVRRDLEAWRPHTSGAFALELFPGDHFYLRTQETLALTTVSRILGTTLGGVR